MALPELVRDITFIPSLFTAENKTGKSRLLDEVASLGQLSAEQLRSMSGGVPLSDDFLSTVVGWIPLCATYSGNTSYLDFENDHPMAFFAIRLLLS